MDPFQTANTWMHEVSSDLCGRRKICVPSPRILHLNAPAPELRPQSLHQEIKMTSKQFRRLRRPLSRRERVALAITNTIRLLTALRRIAMCAGVPTEAATTHQSAIANRTLFTSGTYYCEQHDSESCGHRYPYAPAPVRPHVPSGDVLVPSVG